MICRDLCGCMQLMECLRDSLFGQYGCVILDEAHKRTLHTDVLLGKEFTNNLRRVLQLH